PISGAMLNLRRLAMKKLLWLGLFSLLSGNAFAQHRGGFGGSFGRGGIGHGGVAPGGSGRAGFGPHANWRVGFRHGFGFPPQGFGSFGIPPLGPIPPLGINAPFSPFDHRFHFAHGLFGSSVFFSSGFPVVAGGFDYGYPATPNVIIVQQPVPQTILEEKPREVRPEIREYKEGGLPPPALSRGEQPAFVIVLKNGTTHLAVVMWVQENLVHYHDPEGRH